MAQPQYVYHFTLEAVGKCENHAAAEYWLRMAAHALEQLGFAMDDAQAIGITGGKGARVPFPDPVPEVLTPIPLRDERRLSDVPGRLR